MATITAQGIINKAKILLQDTTSIRWPETELLDWLNDGQREIASLRPDVSNKTALHTLVAGTKQALAAEAAALIEVRRNMGVNGTTPGDAIRKVPTHILDSQLPTWHSMTASAVVKHYCYDPRTPRLFYVFPPSLGTTQIEVAYDCAPADVTIGAVIGIDDEYANAILEYVLFRAYSKDHEEIGNVQLATAHRVSFDALLGAKAAVDASQVSAVSVRG